MFPHEAQLQSCLSGLVEAMLAPPAEAKTKTTAQKIGRSTAPVSSLV